jgi:hypothetical protein
MRVTHWLFALAIGVAAGAGHARTAFFETDTPLAVTLAGPFSKIAGDTTPDPAYRPATISFRDEAGVERSIALEVKPRGKSRRREEVCQFPPLRLDFPKEGVKGTPFEGFDKVKLVTHCSRLGSSDARTVQRLRLELVVYRLFNRITDESFRVRPLEITYVDTDRGGRESRHAGFLLEPERHLAKRLGLRTLERDAIERSELDPVRTNRAEVFQYLIGNTDFSFIRSPAGHHCCHNVVLLAGDTPGIVPVPYDFDSTGVVDPPYAEPVPSLGIRNVRQRLYRGYCREPAILEATLAQFRAARADLLAIVADDPVLSDASKRKTSAYIEEFYRTIDSPQETKRRIADRCI